MRLAASASPLSGAAGALAPEAGLPAGAGLFGAGPPGMPIATGVAAPSVLAGVIAATWLAYRMKVPALAARAPPGATKVATGTGEDRMSLIMLRIAPSRPPGVSICSTSSCACCLCASARPRRR